MSIFDECRDISCIAAAQALGVPLKKNTGIVAWAMCPLHGERGHPSLFISSERGWYCYGCHRGGHDAISLYQAILGLDPLDAARQCARDFNRATDDDYEPTLHVSARHLISALHKRRDKIRTILATDICDLDDAIQVMIHSDGMEACAEDDRFMDMIGKKARLQLELDQLTDADDVELLELLKEYEGRKNEN